MSRLGLAALLLLICTPHAGAANPGANGRIAFVRLIDWRSYTQDPGSIWTVSADGTNPRRITRTLGGDRSPAWSPDGRRIAFSRWTSRDDYTPGRDAHELFVVNADGTGLRRLTRNHVYDGEPTWSPDGRRIAFVRAADPIVTSRPNADLWVIGVDGSGARRLTRSSAVESGPAWGPGGRSIAYLRRDLERRFVGDAIATWVASERTDVWTLRVARGTQRATGFTSATFRSDGPFVSEFLTEPDWSPGGARLVLGTPIGAATVRPNGDELGVHACEEPAWSPGGAHLVCSRGTETDRFIHTLALETGATRQVTTNPYPPHELTNVFDFDPAWQPVRRG